MGVLITIGVIAVISLTICILASIFVRGDYYDDADREVLTILFGGIFVASLGFLIPLTCTFTSSANEVYAYIVSIRNSAETSGNFFLGSGFINNTEYYCYYKKEGTGYKFDKIQASQCIVYETDDREPCIYHIKEKNSWKDYYEIYVPTNTIITQYVLK